MTENNKKEELKKKEREEKEKKEREEKEKKEKEEKEKKEREEREKKEKEEKEKKEKEDKEKKEKEDKEKKEKEKEKKEKEEKEKNKKKNNLDKDNKIPSELLTPENKTKDDKEKENIQLKEGNKNKIIDAISEIYNFNNNIKKEFSEKNKSFLLKCSIINKDWYKQFLDVSQYEFFKKKFEDLKIKNVEEIHKTINNDINKIDFNRLESLKENKDVTSKPLDNIEDLAFVSETFLNKMNDFMKANNNKEKDQNKNILENNKKEIMIKNGQALLKMNDNKFIYFNPHQNNINEIKNQQVFEFPKNKKIDLFNIIQKDEKNDGIKNIADNEMYKTHLKPLENIIKPIPSFKEETKKIKKTIDKPSSLGLDNVGATCYMNATLQCLAHIKKVSERIINYKENNRFNEDKKKYQMTRVYADVLKGIWFPDKSKNSFAPHEFKEVLGKMNSLFAPTAANDAKDLLIYLIEQMHNELNNSKEENLALLMPDDMDPTNQKQVFECFAGEFMKKYNSVFSHYFYGSNMSMTCCLGCNIIKYSYQCFSFLIFPLLEAKRYCVLSGRIPQFFYNQYTLNIEDCFLYNQKIEFFTGDNRMYCNQCRQLMNSSMGTRISTAPLVFILVLNRGRGNQDFKEKFVFWEIIDLTNYVDFKQPDNRYFLAGVITHLGESGAGGHFIAFCRMSEKSPWFCYNDSMVTESSFSDINTRGTPYILFYQKIILE